MLLFKNKPGIDEFIAKYGKTHPLLNELENTVQEPEWHREGNVKNHTSMVLSELYAFMENDAAKDFQLSERELEVLMFACVYHDYAKPITTKEDERDGIMRIVASHHEDVGAGLLVNAKKPDELSSEEWLLVTKLVAFHQMPKRLAANEARRGKYLELLQDVGNLSLLYILEVADMKGRICPDLSMQLLYLDCFFEDAFEYLGTTLLNDYLKDAKSSLFKADNQGIYANRGEKLFNQALAEVRKNRACVVPECFQRDFAHKEKQSHVVALCGVAGSGKSTLIKEHYPSHKLISLDEIREEIYGKRSHQADNGEVRRIAMERLKECLRRDEDVVWDACNYRRDFRGKVLDISKQYKAYTELCVIVADKDLLLERNKSRDNPIPLEAIDKQLRNFQMPSAAEADKVWWHCANTNTRIW